MFVHARNATVRTALGLLEMARNGGETCYFQGDQGADYGQWDKQVGGASPRQHGCCLSPSLVKREHKRARACDECGAPPPPARALRHGVVNSSCRLAE